MLSTLHPLFRALNQGDVRYLIVGGLAVVAHGYARLTVDVDLALDLEEGNTRRAVAVFERLGYRPAAPVPLAGFADRELRTRWREEKNMVVFSLVPPDRKLPVVDLFTATPFDFEVEAARCERLELRGGLVLPVIARESLIAMKRALGRAKDLADIEGLEALGRDTGGKP